MAQSIWPQVIPTHPSPDPINVKQVLADFMGGTPPRPTRSLRRSLIHYLRNISPTAIPANRFAPLRWQGSLSQISVWQANVQCAHCLRQSGNIY